MGWRREEVKEKESEERKVRTGKRLSRNERGLSPLLSRNTV